MSIYTKRGDKGQTGLPGERRASKTDQLFEVLGHFDQTNAVIGLAIAQAKNEDETTLVPMLEKIQGHFLTLGALLAAEEKQEEILQKLASEVVWMEEQIDEWDAKLPGLRNFILAGGTPAGATLHLARASVRQTERQFHRLKESDKPAAVAQYLNRLSDWFFEAARYYNFTNNAKETVWKPSN